MMKLSNTNCLLDTNILIALVDNKNKNHRKAVNFLRGSDKSGLKLVISSQNILELAAVLTNTLKISRILVTNTLRKIVVDPKFKIVFPYPLSLEKFVSLLQENPTLHPADLFLIATSITNNVSTFVTDDRDFIKVKGIKVYNPFISVV